jgi:hypothetical protein
MGARYLLTPPGECWGGDPLPPLVDWARHQATIGARRLEVDVRLVPPLGRNLAAITAALQVAHERQAELVVVGASAQWHSTLDRLGLDTLGLRWIPPPLPDPPRQGLPQPGDCRPSPGAGRSMVPA